MGQADHYEGREQSLVKHKLFQRYLETFAHKIGSYWESITYIDGFSGPWNSKDEELSDSSFAIAIKALREARDNPLTRRLKRLRCVFVESSTRKFKKLKAFADAQKDIQIKCICGSFEDVIPDVIQFIGRDPGTFAFTFIDPTGWTGFAMKKIQPLLQRQPGEVLVNFMTSFITRLIENTEVRSQFEQLYGSNLVFQRVSGTTGLDRVDVCVEEYCAALARFGGFKFVCPAYVLKPLENRPHFNLIYATRKPIGVKVYRDAEKAAMADMETARAKAEERETKARTKQPSLFSAEEAPESWYYRTVRDRYLCRALAKVRGALESMERVPYDRVWEMALAFPLVWESDLKEWIRRWHKEGKLSIEGASKSGVPKYGERHVLVWSK